MTIIKDQLIEAQLEVIDNASLPSGRPVGSVYYNKTTEKIQTVKQDGNLRNVFYEDEVSPHPNVITQYIKESNYVDFIMPSDNQYRNFRRFLIIIGRTYTLSGGIDVSTSEATAFMSMQLTDSTVNGNNIGSTMTPLGSKLLHRFTRPEGGGSQTYHIPFNVTFVATETYLNILVRTASLNTKIDGSFTNTGSSYKTAFTLKQHPNYQEVGAFS